MRRANLNSRDTPAWEHIQRARTGAAERGDEHFQSGSAREPCGFFAEFSRRLQVQGRDPWRFGGRPLPRRPKKAERASDSGVAAVSWSTAPVRVQWPGPRRGTGIDG